MSDSRSYYDYRYFVRRWGQLLQCWYLTQQYLSVTNAMLSEVAIEKILKINVLREGIQKEIGDLNSTSFACVCHTCTASCCMGSYNHYGPTDFLLRKWSSSPLLDYRPAMHRPWGPRFRQYAGLGQYADPAKFTNERTGCSYLSRSGCTLDISSRPIMCVAFACGRFRAAMTDEVKKQYAKLLEALYHDVCISVFDILKEEAEVAWYHGRLSLWLIPC